MAHNWTRERTYVLEHHLHAAVLWERARFGDKPHTNLELAQMLGRKHATVAQYALAGKSILTINRAYAIATHLGLTRIQMANRVRELERSLRQMHKNLTIITRFPRKPPEKNERLLRAYSIEDMLDGQTWPTIFGPNIVEPDMVWRARIAKRWSRREAAEVFKCTQATIAHWERVHTPLRRCEQLEDVYGSLLL